MSRIYISEKLKSMFGKIALCTTLCLGPVGLTGCSSDSKEIETEAIVSTENNDIIHKKKSRVYDFQFARKFEADTNHYDDVDWSEIENSLEQKYYNFCNILRLDTEETNHNYEVAVFEDPIKFNEQYFKIVDKNGWFQDDIMYSDIIPVNEHTIVLEKNYLGSEESFSRTKNYTILNKNIGITKSFSANNVFSGNGYISKKCSNGRDSEGYLDYKYQLLYENGTVASDELYDDIINDYSTGRTYLQMGGKTELLDTKTGKARIIDGEVTRADQNFLVLRTKKGNGVYYLPNIKDDLIEKIPCNFREIKFLEKDEFEPIFSCEDSNNNMAAYSVNGERLSNYYNYMDTNVLWRNKEYLWGLTDVDYKNDISTISILDKNGTELSKFTVASQTYINNIDENTGIIMYCSYDKNDKNDKYGFMDLSGKILQNLIYDRLIRIDAENNNGIEFSYYIGRIESEGITVVLDENLNELFRGDYMAKEAEKMGYEILTNNRQKKLTRS